MTIGQNEVLSSVVLKLFKDEKLKELMDIPLADRNNLSKFIRQYVVQSLGTHETIDSTIPVRIHVYWDGMSEIDSRDDHLFLRWLSFDVYVQTTQQYGILKSNGTRRRTDLITERISQLLHNKRVEGFLVRSGKQYDMNSNTLEFSRKKIDFTLKHIN